MEGAAAERPDHTRLLLLLALGSTLLAKLAFAWRFDGYMTGDDLEVVESAAKYALGLHYQPWDIRCLFHPLAFVWPVMKLAVGLGATDPGLISWTAALPTALFSTAAVWLVFVLAREWGWSPAAALAAAALYGCHPLSLIFGSTPYPRPISTALLLGAFVLAGDENGTTRVWIAGCLAGLAFGVRWSEAVVLLPLALYAAWRSRNWRRGLMVVGGFCAGAFLSAGVFDWVTRGAPFASFQAFFRTMYFEIPGSRLAQEAPFYYYGWTLLRWAGPIQILLLLFSWKDARSRLPSLLFLSVVVLLSVFAHKESRYLQCAVPFLALASALGWERIWTRGHRVAAVAVLLVAMGWGVERSVSRLSGKSQPAIAAARFIRRMEPPPRVVALEQNWAYGDRLYLGNYPEIRDILWQRSLTRLAIREAGTGADVVGVYADHVTPPAKEELAALGLQEVRSFRKDAGRECVVYASPRFVAGVSVGSDSK